MQLNPDAGVMRLWGVPLTRQSLHHPSSVVKPPELVQVMRAGLHQLAPSFAMFNRVLWWHKGVVPPSL